MVLLLQQAGWLDHKDICVQGDISDAAREKTDSIDFVALLNVTTERMAQWKKEIAVQELGIAMACRNILNLNQQVEILQHTEVGETQAGHECKFLAGPCPVTETTASSATNSDSMVRKLTPCELITKIRKG